MKKKISVFLVLLLIIPAQIFAAKPKTIEERLAALETP